MDTKNKVSRKGNRSVFDVHPKILCIASCKNEAANNAKKANNPPKRRLTAFSTMFSSSTVVTSNFQIVKILYLCPDRLAKPSQRPSDPASGAKREPMKDTRYRLGIGLSAPPKNPVPHDYLAVRYSKQREVFAMLCDFQSGRLRGFVD